VICDDLRQSQSGSSGAESWRPLRVRACKAVGPLLCAAQGRIDGRCL